MPLKIGDNAPDLFFKLISSEVKELKGKKIILYFYPQDDTPTCTIEACNLRDDYKLLKSNGFEVIGVSPDSEKSHQKFTKKFTLPFNLIADTEKELIRAFEVWGEKKMFGRPYMGVLRKTFIISENGIIEKIIDKVTSKKHANQILKVMGMK